MEEAYRENNVKPTADYHAMVGGWKVKENKKTTQNKQGITMVIHFLTQKIKK
jgi:hypothetical protein